MFRRKAPDANQQVAEALARAAAAEARAEEAEARAKEERKAKEEAEARAKEERKAKEEAEARAEEEKRGREEDQEKAEAERKAREEVNGAAFLEGTLQEATINFAPVYPEIVEDAEAPVPKRTKSTSISEKKSFQHVMPAKVQRWNEFSQEMDQVLAHAREKTVKKPAEVPPEATDFNDEKAWMLYWGIPREATIKVLKQLYDQSPLVHGKTTTETPAPGYPDELFAISVNKSTRLVSVLEHKHPEVDFETEMDVTDIVAEGEPSMRKLAKKYVMCSLVQTYTYMTLNRLKYGMFSNYNHWVFLKRAIDEAGNEVIYASPWIGLERARLAWATITVLACRDLMDDVCQGQGEHFGQVPEWIVTRNKPTGGAGGSGGSGTAGGDDGGVGTITTGGGGGPVDSTRAAYPETTTKEALGVTALSLLNSYQVLGNTDKSHTRRVHVNGQDLCVKLVDYLGTPKHTEFSAEMLDEMEWNEVRVYHYLQQRGAQGRVAPHFLYHGSDFNQIWATAVTTYEGESLALILEREGSLTPQMQAAAITSLRELHTLGVLHDDVALRNAIWRPRDGAVIWVDYELSELSTECVDFAGKCLIELEHLQAVLRETNPPPLPAAELIAPPPAAEPTLTAAIEGTGTTTDKGLAKSVKRSKICPCFGIDEGRS